MSTMIAPKTLNAYVTSLLQAQSGYVAAVGSIANTTLWATAAPTLKNGNAMLILPGPLITQMTVKAGGMLINIGGSNLGLAQFATDQAISAVFTAPGARTDGTNLFFSTADPFNETVLMVANKYAHFYMVYDTTKTGNAAIGMIVNSSPADPSLSLYSFLGTHVSARQAVVFVNANADPTLLASFPAMVNRGPSVTPDFSPAFQDWHKAAPGFNSNAMTMQFTFPPGTGNGLVGEVAIFNGTVMIGYLPVSPEIQKDSDIPLVVTYNLMVGEPGAFI